ncbi:GMC oxidoreductase [Phanerochaete sordida]|uniref:GMC oxidoreductase n=1 Tax=Phanerochaete sordida TaxID=48140 RepID=A0A9P3FX47_9APHY|nr:GMC oxidoreductase [Phanerochaete sordida]
MWPFSSPAHTTCSVKDVDQRSFDYIIVGGGTGGCVLASRLSEDKDVTVLLIERGPVVDSWYSRVPLLSVDFRDDRSPTYQWKSVVNAAASKVVGPINMISGKALGGTSKVNAFCYTRSVPGEFNSWASQGRKGWSWTDVEPYFRKSETSLSNGEASHRGSSGLWHNQQLSEMYFRNTNEILEAAESLGIPRQKDIHDPAVPPYSCGLLDVTVDETGRRHSTFDAFLPPEVTSRPNLSVCIESIVTRLDIKHDDDGIRVAGVYLESSAADTSSAAVKCYASVSREVIMCAGVIANPQILMLSGLGPKRHLKEMGIAVVKDLPGIGSHLQDHPSIPLIYKVPRNECLHDLEYNPLRALWHTLRYVFTGTGLLLSPCPQLVIFAKSKLLDEQSQTVPTATSADSHAPDNVPDIEITCCPFNMSPGLALPGGDGALTLACMLLKPRSAGSVRLTSLNAHDRPACDLAYLSAPEDYAAARAALKLGLALGRQCRAQGHAMRDALVPASEADADLDAHARTHACSTYHYSSTCRMAPEAERGVVDDVLRVHGVRNLRVADASVFPDVPAAHPQAPVVMVAERCADFVKAARRET